MKSNRTKLHENIQDREDDAMKKITIFLILLTIFMFAGTYFKTIAVAAEIAWINKSKGRVHY